MAPENVTQNVTSVNTVSLEKTPADFKLLKKTLARVDEAKAYDVTLDDEITLDDVVVCLDRFEPGLTRDDFLTNEFMRQPRLFHQIDTILGRHNIHLASVITDWELSLAQFIKTGQAPPAYLASITFVSQALQRDGNALRYVWPHRFPADYGRLVRIACRQNPHAIRHASEAYVLTVPRLVQYVLRRDPTAIKALSTQVQMKFPHILRPVIIKNPALLKHTSAAFQIANPDILNEVVRERATALAFVHEAAQKMHRDVVLTALYQSDEAYSAVSPTLKLSPDFLADAVMANHAVFEDIQKDKFLTPFLKTLIWNQVVSKINAAGLKFPEGMLTSYDAFLAGLAEHGVTNFPKRIRSFETVYQLMQDRQARQDDIRPVALLLYNTHDNNTAFDNYPVIDTFAKSGFRVIYQEIETDQDYFYYLDKYTNGGKNPVHTLVIAGHGSQTSLVVGESSLATPGDAQLDVNDFTQCFGESPVASGGQIFLYACLNGKGRDGAANLANVVASSFPDDVTVYSLTTKGNILTMDIGPDLSLHLRFWVTGDNPTDPLVVSEPYVIGPGMERTLGDK